MESYPSLRFASPHLSLRGTLLLFTEAKKESQSRLFFLEAIYGGKDQMGTTGLSTSDVKPAAIFGTRIFDWCKIWMQHMDTFHAFKFKSTTSENVQSTVFSQFKLTSTKSKICRKMCASEHGKIGLTPFSGITLSSRTCASDIWRRTEDEGSKSPLENLWKIWGNHWKIIGKSVANMAESRRMPCKYSFPGRFSSVEAMGLMQTGSGDGRFTGGLPWENGTKIKAVEI